MTLDLTTEETQFILNVLGNLPTSSGAFPLCVKISEQVQEQSKASGKVQEVQPKEEGK